VAFLDKLGDLARNIGDKTSDAIETNKLNGKIGAEKTAITECMRRIGEICYQKYQTGDAGDPAALEFLTAIDGHNKAIADLRAEIERIKAKSAAQIAPPNPAPSANGAGGIVCPSCGHANPTGTKFCQECGAKIETPAVPPPAAIPAPSADGANGAGGIVCSSCGHANPASTKFCQECGAKIETPAIAERVCHNCGRPVPAANAFCGECGHKFE
jgi:uncharacterized small protein (DUF1192 family)/RNA polymerase subunit RPABC4/transcription elongation factor Spt4